MNYIVTGGHSGMGLELTKKLLSEGNKVGLIVRNEIRKQEAKQLFSEDNSIEIFVADLSKRNKIESVANDIINQWNELDGLYNNAGLLLGELQFSKYGNEMQLEVNAISPFLLTKSLKPLLDKADEPFVVSTATAGLHRIKSIDIAAFKNPTKFTKLTGSYRDSKLMLVLLMNYLDESWNNIRFVNVNPGAIKTKMTAGEGMPIWLRPIRNLLFQSPEKGAMNLYNATFDKKVKGSGILVDGSKIRTMSYKISDKEVDVLLDL